jgi:hypothetical protein
MCCDDMLWFRRARRLVLRFLKDPLCCNNGQDIRPCFFHLVIIGKLSHCCSYVVQIAQDSTKVGTDLLKRSCGSLPPTGKVLELAALSIPPDPRTLLTPSIARIPFRPRDASQDPCVGCKSVLWSVWNDGFAHHRSGHIGYELLISDSPQSIASCC